MNFEIPTYFSIKNSPFHGYSSSNRFHRSQPAPLIHAQFNQGSQLLPAAPLPLPELKLIKLINFPPSSMPPFHPALLRLVPALQVSLCAAAASARSGAFAVQGKWVIGFGRAWPPELPRNYCQLLWLHCGGVWARACAQ